MSEFICNPGCNPRCSTVAAESPESAPRGASDPEIDGDVSPDRDTPYDAANGAKPRLETPSAPDRSSTPRAYFSRARLLKLEASLTDLDWRILSTIRMCKVVLGRQIGRLYFHESKTEHSGTVLTNRELKRLVELGLIDALNQKVDCRARGYVAYIYFLTDAGERILQIHLGEPCVRKRSAEPSMGTLAHTLSVVECYVQTVEACRAGDMKLREMQLEPDSWRGYARNFKQITLKPDRALVTEKQDWETHEEPWYELRWFIEVDLNTENIQTLMEKCRRYYEYYRSDTEQRLHDDVFPLVVWIVKTEGRKATLIQHIRETFPNFPRIFAVILPDEYVKLLRDELPNAESYICPA